MEYESVGGEMGIDQKKQNQEKKPKQNKYHNTEENSTIRN